MKFLNDEFQGKAPYEGDFFNNRKEYGESLKKIIDHVEDGCVISIDEKWGEGKTTFVKWWCEDLKAVHCPVYFDAFQYDFNSDPFIAIVKVLYDQFPEEKISGPEIKEKLRKLTDEIIPNLMKLGAMVSATAIMSPKHLATFAASAGIAAIGDTVKNFLTKKEEKTLEKVIQEFREMLNTITSELFSKDKKKLIFIIDELDRCRPSFAVETIEKIKHLFSVTGIIWVLVMNKDQLEESIRHVYGTIDAKKYLSKFIDIESSLPKEIRGNYDTFDHYKKMIDGLISSSRCKILKNGYSVLVVLCSRIAQLSIRDIKKVLLYCEFVFGEKNTNYAHEYTVLGILLSVIKMSDDQTYKLIKNKNTSIYDLKKNGITARIFNEGLMKTTIWYLYFAMTTNEHQRESISLEFAKSSGLIEIETEYNEFQKFCTNNGRIIEYAKGSLEGICKRLDIFEFV